MGPQFSWIEANLPGFFIVDVRNSKGKFDEIKRWNRDYHASMDASLHSWKQRILEIRLISSQINQKLKKKREIHHFLKRNLAQKPWPIGAVVGAICRGRGSGSFGRRRGFNLMMNPPQFWRWIGFDREHDRPAIGPQLSGDWILIAWRSSCDRGASINVAFDAVIGDDRGAIGTRLRDDRVTIARRSWFFAKERQPFDEDQVCRPMLIR